MKTLRELKEKTLTPAEIKKRDEIAKAMKKDDPDMPMDKKMAIATATAKRVAEEKSVRQLIDPKKEVMVVKMMGKRHKVIVIDKSKEKEYLSKGWMLAEETQLNEDGHTDVASMKNKVKIAMSALQKMQTELGKLQDGDSLPSWWTNKVAVAVDKIDGMADYIDTQVESVELEESDVTKLYSLYNKAMKMIPGSPAQKKVSAEIEKLRKKLGMDESLNETVSAALHIKGMRTATAHAKKDGANIKDKNVLNKYFIYHMKKNNRMTHFKKDANGNLDFNSIGNGTKIEPKHYKDIFNKTKNESTEYLEEATDLYNKGGIQIVRFAAGKGRVGVEITVKKGNSPSEIGGQIVLSDTQFKNLQRALPKINLREGLGESLEEAVSPAQQAAIAISKKERGEKPKNEASAAADARRAMKSRGATKGMALTKKDRDIEATDDDRKAASKNIIMQLRKAADLPAGAEIVFNRGKGKVTRDQANAALARFDALSKPNEKERFQKSIRSLADIKKILGR